MIKIIDLCSKIIVYLFTIAKASSAVLLVSALPYVFVHSSHLQGVFIGVDHKCQWSKILAILIHYELHKIQKTPNFTIMSNFVKFVHVNGDLMTPLNPTNTYKCALYNNRNCWLLYSFSCTLVIAAVRQHILALPLTQIQRILVKQHTKCWQRFWVICDKVLTPTQVSR